MSLSASLNSALVGLDLAARRAQTVSENVANAGRPGFGKRELLVSPIAPQLTGLRTQIERTENSGAVAVRREAGGLASSTRDPAALWAGLESVIGIPGTGLSLSDSFANLEARLIDASTRPASTDALVEVSRALADVAFAVNATSGEVQAARQKAEDDIVVAVTNLNRDLASVQDLNVRIQKLSANGGETARLEDQRALALDRIAESVGIRVLPRDFGMIAIISDTGQILLDGKAKTLEFTPSIEVTPDRFLGLGLNPIQIDGRDVSVSGPSSLSGGRLQGLFNVRDIEAPNAQARLDAFASELVTRFSGPNADTTLAAGEAGLFIDPGTGEGTASRIQVNPLVDLNSSGEVWRIRDGLNSVIEDPVASAVGLERLLDVLAERTTPGNPLLGTAPRSVQAISLDLTSLTSSQASHFESEAQRATALLEAANAGLEASAVDIDEEMRRLIEVEQSYAAAARIVSVVDEMMDRLTRL